MKFKQEFIDRNFIYIFFMALFKIVVWAIIFLTKLRFPPGISITIIDHRVRALFSFT